MSQYQKGKTNLDFTEARDSEWQWHQLGNMQVCTSLQTDNDASTPPLSFLQFFLPCPDLLNNFVSSAYMYIIDVMISVIATQLRCGGIFKYEFVANLINTWWNI